MFDDKLSTSARHASHRTPRLAFNPLTGTLTDRRQEAEALTALWPERRKIGLIVITILFVASLGYTIWTSLEDGIGVWNPLFLVDAGDIAIAGIALWCLITNRRGYPLDAALFIPGVTLSIYVALDYAGGLMPWDAVAGILIGGMCSYGIFFPHRPPFAIATLCVFFGSYIALASYAGETSDPLTTIMIGAIWFACMRLVHGWAIQQRNKVFRHQELESLNDRLDQNVQSLELEKQAVERAASENAALADKLALARIEAEEKTDLLEVVLDNIPQGVLVVGLDAKVIECSQRFAEFMHLPEDLTLPGTPIEAIFDHAHEEGVLGSSEERDFAIENVRSYASKKAFEPLVIERESAPNLFVEIRFAPMPGGGIVATTSNITERKLAEAGVRYKALHDTLTGLANRELFRDRLEAAIARAGRTGHYTAVAMVDLDKFKPVNDTYGHPVGDALLQEVGKIFKRAVREVDTVARLGGDEFAIIFDGIAAIKDISTPLDRILGRLVDPIRIGDDDIHVGASIGVAFYPLDAHASRDIERRADEALFEAKRTGRSRYCLAQPAYLEGLPKVAQL